MHSLSQGELEQLIQDVTRYEDLVLSMTADRERKTRIVGSLLQGVPTAESRVLQLACGRLGYGFVDLGWDDATTKSDEEIINESSMYSSVVDILVTGFVDRETMGAGRATIERIARTSTVPVLSLADELFAPQSALAMASSFWDHLDGLKGKRVSVCWGFGSKFVLPNSAHSLLLILATLGADVVLAAPPDFPLLKRVIRDAEKRAEHSGSRCEISTDLQESIEAADAVFAANWCRLDDFNHPERNVDHASHYRDWYFTDDTLLSDCLFMTEPPAQSDLLLDAKLEKSFRNLTDDWISKRVHALTASFKHVDRGQVGENQSNLI